MPFRPKCVHLATTEVVERGLDPDTIWKVCSSCDEAKPLSEYFNNPGAADGTFNKCKPCYNGHYKQRQRMLRRTDPEWRSRERARIRRYNRKNQGRFPTPPQRRKVYNTFRKAVEEGRVVPTDTCFDCGHDFNEHRREAHHEDYSRPLDVVWLCSLCHGARHQT